MRVAAAFCFFGLLCFGREFRVRIHGGQIITISAERYVEGVLMGEVSTLTAPEAFKAMAVAARTFAMHYTGRHAVDGFDFCETTHCQDYRAYGSISSLVRAAVEATESELLWFDGKPAAAYYHRQCGGQTAAGNEVWPDLFAPYLRSISDTFCFSRGRAEWSSELPVRAEVVRRTASGRVAELTLEGRRISVEQFQHLIGSRLGWNQLRSNKFVVSRTAGGIRVTGVGYGHGVGLCQIGAEERGRSGHDYLAILAAYYPGTSVGVAASGLRWRKGSGERVDVMATNESAIGEVLPLAEMSLARAERMLGIEAPVRAMVRVYPTIAVYRDATGSAGSVAATTAGKVVRLQPSGLLRSRGVLESTVLHEMLHVVVETNAHPSLPAWFREGVVQQMTGGNDSRIRELERQYGRAAVLRWIRSGLPPSLGQDGQRSSGTRPQ